MAIELGAVQSGPIQAIQREERGLKRCPDVREVVYRAEVRWHVSQATCEAEHRQEHRDHRTNEHPYL